MQFSFPKFVSVVCLMTFMVDAPSTLLGAESKPGPPDQERVGRQDPQKAVTPVNQVLTPLGKQLDLPGMRPQALAIAPNGTYFITSGKTNELLVIDLAKAQIRQRVPLPATDVHDPVSSQLLNPEKENQLSFTGLIFSPGGDRIYMSNVDGFISVFNVTANGEVSLATAWSLGAAKAPRRLAEIPSGLAISADGSKLYVCGNLSNRLFELDVANGKTVRTFDVGVAPFDVALVGTKAYVSNWGGRRPKDGVETGPAGRGMTVRIDPRTGASNDGSVSVIDLEKGVVTKELPTGLHASGLARSNQHSFVVCCNATSDNLSVIDTRSDAVVATLWSKTNASDLLGASPNAAAFDASGRRLYVANGTQNAIAVFDFDSDAPRESKLIGMIPVGWFPGAVAVQEARKELVVANIKGLPVQPPKDRKRPPNSFGSHDYTGSLSIVGIPADKDLPAISERVARNLRAPRIAAALLPPRTDQPPRPVPERIGEPSSLKHVVYIIKENRTYDQVMGDSGRGNSEPSLCVFGRQFTPNQHKIAEDFVLLDNTYCCGILSADGHQWSTTAFATDYMERSFAGFPRSYPDGMGIDENDALAYAPSGFIWDSALAHKKTVRNYGEFMAPSVHWRDKSKKGSPNFLACFNAWKHRTNDVVFECWPSVDTLKPFSPTDYVGWDMSVPDQFRADYIIKELAEFEKKGEYPNLVIICLPQDHTSGTTPNCPTPAACVADNDLAFGRIVEALSHSKFWPQMAVFAIEDDPQAGWDHVSGYRTVAFCASPYAKRGQVVSTQYNTTSILRTIAQILGMRPMNQFDASALPMWDCFNNEPNLTPYSSVPATLALDQMNPGTTAIADPELKEDAITSAALDLRGPDRAPEDVLNRILWRAMRGTKAAYPEWAVTATADDDDDDE
ncbi:MAG: bifunctional YncE family protein/alkaline phosphatase family protein [Pirellulales bacterium]